MAIRMDSHVGKGKVNHTTQESVGGRSSPSPRPWARGWRNTNVGDAWAVQCQTYGYLHSCKASPPIGWYQIILLSDRGTHVLKLVQGCIGQWRGQDSNPWPVDHKSSILTTRPLSHTNHVASLILCSEDTPSFNPHVMVCIPRQPW